MIILRNELIKIISILNLSESLSHLIVDITLFISLFIISIFVYFIIKFIYNMTFKRASSKTNNIFVKTLVASPVIPNALKLIPAMMLNSFSIPLITINGFTDVLIIIIFAYVTLKIATSLLDLINSLYNEYDEKSRSKPIKGILTFIKIVIITIVLIVVISSLVGQSPGALLAGLGAMSAVIMLIFQDSILGLVAGFQMSSNDLIRIGDWIEMPKYGVDGNVIDVTLTFIRVENWDKTTVTLPAHKLISESFTNWRSVFDLGGRRIKRSVSIDANSVKIIDDELYDKLLKVDYLKDYLVERQKEIDEHNKKQGTDSAIMLNGRRLTNLGVYRIYLTEYLKNHPDIHQGLWIIVRQLQTNNAGIPLEVYTFSSNTAWASYEAIQSDIFDHIYATTNYFDLKIFQEPSGIDFKEFAKK